MALPSLQRTQIMDIYLFGFIIFTIGSLVVTILVMYGHSTAHKEEISKLQTDFSYYAHFLEAMLNYHCIEYDKPPQYQEIHDLVDSIIEETTWGSMVEANSWFDDYYHASEYKGNQPY